MLLIGVTGNMAAGKSTISRIFKQQGAFVIDADTVGHELLESNVELRRQMLNTLGHGILDDYGNISRKRLGDMVFADIEKLQALTEIFSPFMMAEIQKQVNNAQKIFHRIVIDAALIVEWNAYRRLDRLVVVTAPLEVRLARLTQLKRLPTDVAEMRLNAQMPQEEKVKLAHYVIENSGGLDELESKALEVWQKIVQYEAVQ